ncbi:restriction endonuclease subunit S [Candidatus Saccharibacteria bacterium]|nr:restriction endonuclease subunit S [Candidatus Saccharibacteria bacterium]
MKTVKLGDVCQIVNGGTPKTGVAEYWDGDILWITPKDLGKIKDRETAHTSRQLSQAGIDNSSAKVIPAHSVILSTRAPIGHVVINTKPMAFNQGCRGLIPGDCIIAEYLYYFLKLSKKYLNELGTGTTFRELSTGALKGVDLPLPSLDEQKKIVERLDVAFERISAAEVLMRRNLDNVAALQKSILHKYLSADDSTHTHRFADLVHIIKPKLKLQRKQFLSKGLYPIISQEADFINGYWDDKNNLIGIKKPVIVWGDHTTVVKYVDFPFVSGADGTKIFEPISSVDVKWLYYYIQYKPVEKLGYARHYRILKDSEVEVPPLKTQIESVQSIEAAFRDSEKLAERFVDKLTKLTELRQSLLSQAFSKENMV